MTKFSGLSCGLTYISGRFGCEQTMICSLRHGLVVAFRCMCYMSKEDFPGLILLFFGGTFLHFNGRIKHLYFNKFPCHTLVRPMVGLCSVNDFLSVYRLLKHHSLIFQSQHFHYSRAQIADDVLY